MNSLKLKIILVSFSLWALCHTQPVQASSDDEKVSQEDSELIDNLEILQDFELLEEETTFLENYQDIGDEKNEN